MGLFDDLPAATTPARAASPARPAAAPSTQLDLFGDIPSARPAQPAGGSMFSDVPLGINDPRGVDGPDVYGAGIRAIENATIGPERGAYLNAAASSGLHTVFGAGARVISDVWATLFGLTTEEAEVLAKADRDAGVAEPFDAKKYAAGYSPNAILDRIANHEQTASTTAMEALPEQVRARYTDLKYATLDPAKSAFLSPTRVAGDILQSLPSTVALALAARFGGSAAARTYEETLAAGATEEAARAAAIRAAARRVTQIGAGSEGAIGYAQQSLQTQQQVMAMPQAKLDQSPEYQELIRQKYEPDAARRIIAARAANLAGFVAGAVDAATNLASGPVLGRLITEGGNLPARAAKGFLTEGLQEAVQSSAEQGGQNLAVRLHADPSQNPWDDVVEQALQGFGVGGVTGGATSSIFGHGHVHEPGKPVPSGVRQQAAAVAPTVTPQDEASPIPTELIVAGRARVSDATASTGANLILSKNGWPAIGTEVNITHADGRAVQGVVEDAFTSDVPGTDISGDGIKIRLTDGRLLETFADELHGAGASITPRTKPGDTATSDLPGGIEQRAAEHPESMVGGREGGAAIAEAAFEPVGNPGEFSGFGVAAPTEPAAIDEPVAAPTGDATPQAPVVVSAAEHMDVARERINTEPTDGQKEAGNYAKGHIKLQGLDITLENPKGSERSGVDAGGQPWSVTMPHDYGYVKRTEGADGEHVDVYVGPDPKSEHVVIVDQQDAKTGKFDEHKVMLGFPDTAAAIEGYKAAFSDGRGAERQGGHVELTVPQFKNYLRNADLTQPATQWFAPGSGTAAKADAVEASEKKPALGDMKVIHDEKFVAGKGLKAGTNARIAIGHDADSGKFYSLADYNVAGLGGGLSGFNEFNPHASVEAAVADAKATLHRQLDGIARNAPATKAAQIATVKAAIDSFAPTAAVTASDTTSKSAASAESNSDVQAANSSAPPEGFEVVGKYDDGSPIYADKSGGVWTPPPKSIEQPEITTAAAAEPTEPKATVTTNTPATVSRQPAITGFKTAKGSSYTITANGTTIRDKAARQDLGHEGQSGIQPESQKTFYVSAPDADLLSLIQTEGGGKMAVAETSDGRIGVKYLDGADRGKFERRTVVKPHLAPAIGLIPVETFKGGSVVHFGNAITELHAPADDKAPTTHRKVKTKPEAATSQDGEDDGSAANERVSSARESAPTTIPPEGERGADEGRDLRQDGGEPGAGDSGRGGSANDAGGSESTGERGGAGEPSVEREGERGGHGVPDVSAASRSRPERAARGLDYRVPADFAVSGSPRERVAANIEAVKLLKDIQDRGALATLDEQRILARFVGWGGLAQIFDKSNQTFQSERDELAELLTPEEWTAAETTTINAHYTAPDVVRGMWSALRELGFHGDGSTLEPGMGIGNFIGMRPDDLPTEPRFTGIELDPVTGGIGRLLYPSAEVFIKGFEQTALPEASFETVIGNVPFANVKPFDKVYNEGRKLSLHNYFIFKSLRLLKPGGVAAMVTSRYTMDAIEPLARERLAGVADLIGAIRLPNTAFKQNAGTEAVTDILFFRRPLEGEPAREKNWIAAGRLDIGGTEMRVNQYFLDNPEAVLGQHATTGSMYGGDSYTVTGKSAGLRARIDHAFKAVVLRDAAANGLMFAAQPSTDSSQAEAFAAPPSAVKDGAYFVSPDGKLMVRDGEASAAAEVKKLDEPRVRKMIELRDLARTVLREQMTPSASDEGWLDAQKGLNTAYDDFVKKFGPINKVQITKRLMPDGEMREYRSYPNLRPFRSDPDVFLVASLERAEEAANAGQGSYAKAAIMSQRVVEPVKVISRVETAGDALLASLNLKGRVDPEYMGGLMGRSGDEVLADLGALVFHDPASKEWRTDAQYLSGNVRQALDIARAAAKKDARYAPNVKALESVQPEDLPPSQIDVRLGAPWVPTDDVSKFIGGLLGTRARVNLIVREGLWTVELADRNTVANTREWGTAMVKADRLITDALNQRTTKITRMVDDKEVVDINATVAAQEAQQKIKDRFSAWVWEEPNRATRLARLYNDTYNATRVPTFDGSHLTLPGSSSAIILRSTQKNAVWRGITGGNVLLDHVVGAGKTYTMQAIGMESKRLGLARKPMHVVPNHMLEQYSREFMQLYPNASLIVADKESFSSGKRQSFTARVATGNWDAVIITHSAQELIPMRPEYQANFLRGEIESYEEMLKQTDDRITIKELRKAVLRRQERIKSLLDAKTKDTGVSFDETGIDMALVDEFHLFKNLKFGTKMRDMSVPSSQRASDMLMKTRFIDEQTPGRNLITATGTPIANSMSEMFTMQRYMAPRDLAAAGLAHFDAWAAQFGDSVTQAEISPDGAGARLKTRFARFRNIPELIAMYRKFADVVTMEDLKALGNIKIPNISGGKPQTVIVPGSEALRAYVQQLGVRAELVRARRVDPRDDNMLKISNDGRLAALDMRLVDPSLPADPERKAVAIARDAAEVWQRSKAARHTQLIFLDLSTPGKAGFNVYDDIRNELMVRGVPRNEIAYIHDADTDAKKGNLFADVREGRVRILLGSTAKMGVGTNVQRLLKKLHHGDAPWRPADLEQRNGRIERQGNLNDDIDISQYATEASFDAYMWQGIERKARFINSIKRGDPTVRTMEDIDEQALSYAEVKALAAGNPLILRKAQVDADVDRLTRLQRAHTDKQIALRYDLARAESISDGAVRKLAGLEKDVAAMVTTRADAFKAQIGGQTYTDRAPAAEALGKIILAKHAEAQAGTGIGATVTALGGLGGFKASLVTQKNMSPAIIVHQAQDHEIPVDLAGGGRGALARLENQVARIPEMIAQARETIESMAQRVTDLSAQQGREFERADDLAKARAQQAEIDKQLMNPGAQPAVTPPDGMVAAPEPGSEMDERVRKRLEMQRGAGTGGAAPLAAGKAAMEARGVRRGADALINRLNMQANLDRSKGGVTPVDRADIHEIESFIHFIGDHMFDTVGLRILADRGPMGQFDVANHIVNLYRKAIEAGELPRTAVHELWHYLDLALPPQDRADVNREFMAARHDWLMANPWAERFIGRDGEMRNVLTGRAADEFARLHGDEDTPVVIGKDNDGISEARFGWTIENYRFANRDEYFAEKMSDRYFDAADMHDEKARSIFAHVRDIWQRMVSGFKQLFGGDATARIFEGFKRGEHAAPLPPTGEGKTLFSHAGGSPPTAPPSGPHGVTFDKASEDRFGDAKKGLGVVSNVVSKMRDSFGQVVAGFSRHYINLPNVAEYSDLHQQLRKLEAAPEAAREDIVRVLRQMVEGMTPDDYDLFTRKVILDDLSWEVEQDHDLPFGMTAADVPRYLTEVDAALAQRPEIAAKVRQRKLFVAKVAGRLVEAGVLHKQQIANPSYYRHVVLDHARASMEAARTGSGERLRQPYWASRKGSTRDINASLLEAEFDWLNKALTDVATANTIQWIKDSDHNVRDDVLAAARAHNQGAIDAILDEDFTKNGHMEKGRRRSPLIDEWDGFKQQIARSFEEVRRLLDDGAIDDIPADLQDVADNLEKGVPDERAFKFLAWLLENNKEGSLSAAGTFHAISARRQWVREQLGARYADPNDIPGLLKRGFGPATHVTWQPEEGKLLYTSKTLPQHMIDGFLRKLSVASDPQISDMLGLKNDAERKEFLQAFAREVQSASRDVLAIGGDKYQLVIPKEVAETLNNLRDPATQNIYSAVLETPVRAWKVWTLLNPRRIVKYNLNNFSGDLDAIVAGAPKALTFMPQAVKELRRVVYTKAAPSQEYRDAVERGVLSSALTLQEVSDIGDLSEFSHLIDKAGSFSPSNFLLSPIGAAWRGMRKFTTFRENWLRYAAYKYYIDALNSGKTMQEIGYGASRPDLVDAVDDVRDKAALLARDLVGDYGAISAYGRGIRKFIIPFWSWTEINTKRYYRLGANAFGQGVGKGLKTSGALGAALGVRTTAHLLLRMVALYGLVQLWNHLFFGDDEDKLSSLDRTQLHILLGHDSKGEIASLRLQGALSDALSWIGLPDAVDAISEIEAGRAGVTDLLEAVAGAPIKKFIGGITPVITEPVDLLTGKSLFPDPFHPRQIRDPWQDFFQTFSLDHEYDALAGKPSKGYLQSLEDAVVYHKDPGEIAYNNIRSLEYAWLRQTKGEEGGGFVSDRSNAMYDYKKALRYDDREAAQAALDRMKELGMTGVERAHAIRRANPLGAIALKDRAKFLATLTPKEREQIDEAKLWYQETFHGLDHGLPATP